MARNAKGADAVNNYAEKQREALTKLEHEIDAGASGPNIERNWAQLVQERDAAVNAAQREAEASALRDEQWAEQLQERDLRVESWRRNWRNWRRRGPRPRPHELTRRSLEQQAADLNRMRPRRLELARRSRNVRRGKTLVEMRMGRPGGPAQMNQTKLRRRRPRRLVATSSPRADADLLELGLDLRLAQRARARPDCANSGIRERRFDTRDATVRPL